MRKRDVFTPEEDVLLQSIVEKYGENDWNLIAQHMKGRNSRQCRDRWKVKKTNIANEQSWTKEEDELLLKLVDQYGTKWKLIAPHFVDRSTRIIKKRYEMFHGDISQSITPENSVDGVFDDYQAYINAFHLPFDSENLDYFNLPEHSAPLFLREPNFQISISDEYPEPEAEQQRI